MTNITKLLDPLNLPLQGERLIEASAGTGKTFIIAALYLRLLLGLGGQSAFMRTLNVEELLVITFTKDATAELRDRIRTNIHNFRIACLRHSSNNPLFQRLLNEITDKQQAAKWLLAAEQKMDEAAIFTIHDFCQRILNFNAFEACMLYEQQLIEDESELRYQACVDFWRRHCYPLPRDIAEVVYAHWKSPKELLCAIDCYLQGDLPTIKSPPLADETLASRHKKILSRIIALKQQWCESAHDIMDIIEKSGIDRRKYNRGNQKKWFEKIDAWAREETRIYQIPNTLKKFSQRFLTERTKPNSIIPKHQLFIAIDNLLAEPLTINDLMLVHAITEIRKTVASEKFRRGALGFDDLLGYLDKALGSDNGESLAAAIRTRFPVAMIDEFQDTDPQQYRIFRYIWYRQPETALLLIGDPKQAIYAFRGADIFTYMKARFEIEKCYTLDTNWRSAPGMVTSVNTLFTQMNPSFIFREITFLPVKAADRNVSLHFECCGKSQPAMRFWLMNGEGCDVKDYQTFMAQQSATQIRDWLKAGARGEALLWRNEVSRPVKASDITVLVRSHQEATLMRDALTQLGIQSVYLSNQDSVFDTLEAQEMLWLLQAVISPERENALRCALASSMLGLTAFDIDYINSDDTSWDSVVEEFIDYRELWQKRGVMAMLRELMMRRHIAENILATPNGERRLTDLMHITELLQEASLQLASEPALIRWLAKHIAKPNINAINQQIRLESDKNLVQIVTIHKSKGLEYPLVCLPFIANYYAQDKAFYHDRFSFEPILDLSQDEESFELAETERLAEDLRLLYVAITRSVWHCSLGVAPLFRRKHEKKGTTDFHNSAIGFLIQKGESKTATGLKMALESLCNKDIALNIPTMTDDNSRLEIAEPASPALEAREICRTIVDDWRVTSYSGLRQQGQYIVQDLMPKLNLDINTVETDKLTEQNTAQLTPHQFPRGALAGTFLHRLFKDLDFTQPVSEDWVLQMLQKSSYEIQWNTMLSEWIATVLKTPLIDNGMSLSQLSIKDRQVEMEFYLPVNGLLQASTLNDLASAHDPLSKICSPLYFRQFSGMIKGYIDLIFRNENRYYLLDYKSNWLGENSRAYTYEAMKTAICMHRYDLQYQLYSLVLHRYLRHRITNYLYDTNFGGVIYLFLRGINTQNPDSGIFTIRPAEALIESMDLLFAKST